ncbi:hypothetical protein J7K93_06840 [bacterium]|nr:hypothetical protein [bacterium]
MNWLHINWPELQKLGATSFQLWNSTEENEHVLFCRYTITDMKNWVKQSSRPKIENIVKPLSECVDIEKTSLKITVIADRLDPRFTNNYS